MFPRVPDNPASFGGKRPNYQTGKGKPRKNKTRIIGPKSQESSPTLQKNHSLDRPPYMRGNATPCWP